MRREAVGSGEKEKARESLRCGVVCCDVVWHGMEKRGERGHYVHEAALENLRISWAREGGSGGEATRPARSRSLNKRLNIPSINFKRCKISANSMVGGCHSFLLPLSHPSALSTPSATLNLLLNSAE